MIRTSKPRTLQWRRKTAVALAASAAFVGGGQALAPAPALATISNGSTFCSAFEVSWFDQFCVQDEPGGGAGPSLGGGGGGASGDSSSGTKIQNDGRNEAIEINVKTVKVPLGTRPDSPRAGSGADPDNSGGPSRSTGGGRFPRCSKTVTQNCRPPVLECIARDGTRRLVWSQEECDEFTKKREQEAERKAKNDALVKARRPAFCRFLQARVKDAEATMAAFDKYIEVDAHGAVIHRGIQSTVAPDIRFVTDAYIKALQDLAESGCSQG